MSEYEESYKRFAALRSRIRIERYAMKARTVIIGPSILVAYSGSMSQRKKVHPIYTFTTHTTGTFALEQSPNMSFN
jgi:hypothetical protein